MSSGLKGYSKPWGDGKPVWVRDAALNDSSKDFVVQTGKLISLTSLYCELKTTATVGNRLLTLAILDDSGNTIFSINWTTQAASLTVYYSAFPGAARNVSTQPFVQFIPVLIIPAGYTIRIYDAAAIDAAADDLTVNLHYVEYDA